MNNLNITQEWQKLLDLTTLRENKGYTIQNNDYDDIIFYIGDTAPEEDDEDYGTIYNNGGQLKNILIEDFSRIYLKLSKISGNTETKRVVIF